MPVARTHSIALVGVEGHPVEIEADIQNGLPGLLLVGLPDTALREARDRIRAAIVNSREQWPQRRITVGLSPASLPKRGSAFDVGIAVAILSAAGSVPAAAIDGMAFLGELGLDGQLRPVRGVLPAAAAAAARGFRRVAVPSANEAEAALVPDLQVLSAPTLQGLLGWLRGHQAESAGPGDPAAPGHRSAPSEDGGSGSPADPGGAGAPVRLVEGGLVLGDGVPDRVPAGTAPDLADVLGQPTARRAAEICAAGGHHLCLLGPPGAGKTMLAERIPTVLPRLDPAAALEVTAIHSVAGVLPDRSPLLTAPPFCAPHHTASKAAIVGGGSGVIRPGAATLAHRGCLFLDEAPEFGRDVLDALRQPLESGEVVVARSGVTARFPARFTLLLAANPCPCARGPGRQAPCGCTPAVRRRYLARLSGPLLDRVDVKVEFMPVSRGELLSDATFAESSATVAARVEAARCRAATRLRDTPWRLNAEVPGSELRRSYAPAPGALAPLERAMDLGQISARGVHRVVRVAWTLADLAGARRPSADQTSAALGLWLGVPPVIHGRDGQHRDRLARAVLTWVAEPGDVQLGTLLEQRAPEAVVAALITGTALGASPAIPGLDRAWPRWAARLGDAPIGATVEAWQRDGIRLVCPGDPEWPSQLDALGVGRPWGLWVRGQIDLRFACLRSVSIVGTRAASGYGIHVTTELAAALAERGWTVVSGGAFGIDGQAHRGALAAEGITVAVLPSGLDVPYPRAHHDLFEAIVAHGALVSEQPPGRAPTRPGFLVRNRLIAALSRGTVVVEAALRSGALNTARHARDQNRPLMAVPGPVTSLASAGCHSAIRDWGAVCVTDVHDVLACLTFSPGDLADPSRGPVLPRDELDPVSLSVLEAVPARGGRGPARIAVSAGVDFDTVMRCLGELAAGGFIERCERGWRVRRPG